MPRRLSLALLASALIAAGCGGSDDGGGGATPSNDSGQNGPTSTEGGGGASPSNTADGRTLFAGTCGGCHTLAAAETSGTFGPNLDELQPDQEQVLAAIRSGPGSMPANLLEGQQAEAVAQYVASAAGG